MKVAQCSFLRFLYPFEFDASRFMQIESQVAGLQWTSGSGRDLPLWDEHRFRDEDFLPHVADFFNPGQAGKSMGRAWRLSSAAMDAPKGIGRNELWFLRAGSRPLIEFKFGWIYLYLFGGGIGFVVVEAKPVSMEATVWYDFVHFFRRADQRIRLKAQLQGKASGPYFSGLAGGADKHPEGEGSWQDVVASLLAHVSPQRERWWRDGFAPEQLLPWTVLYLDGVQAGEESLLLYRARKFFHWEQAAYPSSADLRPEQPGLLSYVDHQWFFISFGGAGFVALDAPDTEFFRADMPAHLGDAYFMLYVMVLQQRFMLTMLSKRVAADCPDSDQLGPEHVEQFKSIRNAFLRFTARGYFSQVSQHDHHHRFYAACQQVLQLDELYREVSDEVHDFYNAVLLDASEKQEGSTRDLETFIRTWTLPLAFTALVLGFLGVNLRGYTSQSDGIPWWHALLFTLLGASLAKMVQWWRHWRKLQRTDSEREAVPEPDQHEKGTAKPQVRAAVGKS